MEPITGLLMLVSSIGMQFATNNANNKQSEKLAELQRRYQDLLDRQRIEHSQQLQIEMNNLQVAMENEVHLLRMKEIENSHDEIIEGLVHGHDIDAWPLYVLPFVIKGKSFGTKIGGGAKTISVHCFLTPSNSATFNRVLYSELDIKLQSDINTNWSTRSTHPIFYYGGAWRDKSADINHIINCVEQLATELRSMPCIVITPYFEEDGVSFRINMWGMGDGQRHTASFEFKNADEDTKPNEIKFSYNYSIKQKFDKSDFEDFGDNALKELDKFLDTTRDEFSAYLQTLIGFITDKYFWSMYGAAPVLPKLLSQGSIYADGMSWIVDRTRDLYETLFLEVHKSSLNHNKLYSLYNGSLPIWEDCNIQRVEHIVNDLKILEGEDGYETWIDPSLYDYSRLSIKNVSIYDMVDTIREFEVYLKGLSSVSNSFALYIEHNDYKVFKFHLFDMNIKKVLLSRNSFDLLIHTKKIVHLKQIHALFGNKSRGSIFCRYEKLDKLVTILESEELIY